MTGRLDGKVALISGGASGLGEACARMFAREGASVVLADLDLDRAKSVLADIKNSGGIGLALRLDATCEGDWEQATADILDRFGKLDIAVNSAGITVGRTSPSQASYADWQRLMAVNLDGVFLGTKHALAAMHRSAPVNGSIINISSILGLVGLADLGAYCASKGGVRLYTKSVALSCARDRIDVRVNSIHPGFIDTPLLQSAVARFEDHEEGMRQYNALAPVGRLGTPDDIAYGAVYLASDESRFVTGTELIIDGGYTAQ